MATKISVEKRLADLENKLHARHEGDAVNFIEVWGGDDLDNPRLLDKFTWNGSEFEVQHDGPE